jgi:ferredoxin-NADP reductase
MPAQPAVTDSGLVSTDDILDSQPAAFGPPAVDPLARAQGVSPLSVWRTAVVTAVPHPTPEFVRIRLAVPDRHQHVPGEHYVLRLTAEDGYVAQRSYSVASDPGDPELELLVEKLHDGEVSSFLADELRVGDELQVRGPIGGWFAWDGSARAIGLGGGTGVVPFVAMHRHGLRTGTAANLRLAVTARSHARLPYADELATAGALIALTGEDRAARADAGPRPAGRLTAAELEPLAAGAELALVCGSAAFARGATDLLRSIGFTDDRIRIEQFGPS